MSSMNESDFPAIVDAARGISSSGTTAMNDFATAMTARATRLTAVRNRLQKSSKTAPAVLQKLDQKIATSTSLSQNLGGLASRIQQRPSVDPSDLAVLGHITGAGASGVWVRLKGNSGSLSIGNRVKVASTGDFSLVFKSCEIPAGTANIEVIAEDAAGTRLAASNPITLKAGSPVYVDLTTSLS